MIKLKEYNKFVQSMELKTKTALLFNYIDSKIYITDEIGKLLGVWDKEQGEPSSS